MIIVELLDKNYHFSFLRPHEGIGAKYAVHLRCIEKPIVDFLFLLVLIELFSSEVRFYTENGRFRGIVQYLS